MNEKRYGVEDNNGWCLIREVGNNHPVVVKLDRRNAVWICDRLNSAYESGLSENEKYRAAWEEISARAKHINSGNNQEIIDEIAARHGIKEE